jgi:MFS family permease
MERQATFKELTLYAKVRELTEKMRQHLARKPILYVVILGAAITKLLAVLFSVYLLLWITCYYRDLGTLTGDEAADRATEIYIRIVVSVALLSIVVFPVVGKLCDVVDPRKLMPFAFLSRCVTTYLFWLLESPESWQCFVVSVAMVIATIGESITCDAIFMKNLNKETRGVLSGAYSFVGQVGTLIFSLLGGWMFDNPALGRKSPFVATGVLDLVFTIIFVAFVLRQKGETVEETDDLLIEDISDSDTDLTKNKNKNG